MITSVAKPSSWSKTEEKYRASAWYYFAAFEWALEWLHYWWSGLAFFKLLELAGRLTVVVAIVVWFTEADNRRTAKEYRAWGLIAAAAGKSGDLGRHKALEGLKAMGVSLAGVPLRTAILPGINLSEADLSDADLSGAFLPNANLSEANLNGADLSEANLLGADLRKADLIAANLSRAVLFAADLSEANLRRADLTEVDLRLANLSRAVLLGADLSDAKFCETIMSDGAINNDDCPK